MENSLETIRNTSHKQRQNKGIYSSHSAFVLVINALVCTAIALFLWLAIPTYQEQSFWSIWVYAQCIGQSICAMLLIWSHYCNSRPKLSLLVRVCVFAAIVVIAFVFGTTLGSAINGHPVKIVLTESVFLISFAVSVLMAAVSTWFYETRVKLATLQLQASEAQLAMLKAQIEPHMLFNTLANLRVLITKNPEEAQALLDQLIDFLRATLDASRNSNGTVGEEFELLQNYLSLMKIRFGERLNYTLNLPDELSHVRLPTLLLQPIVENAIKHGIEPVASPESIRITADQSNNNVIITVENTGTNMDTPVSSVGFGVKSVRDRLKERFAGQATITYLSPLSPLNSGTLVTITLPINYD